VIWAGGGVVAAGGTQGLQRLAERLNAPVIMTDNGRGALPQRHPLALLNLGGRCVLPHADVVLVAGSRAMDALGRPAHAVPGVKYIYLNIDPAPHRRAALAWPRAAGRRRRRPERAGRCAARRSTSLACAGPAGPGRRSRLVRRAGGARGAAAQLPGGHTPGAAGQRRG
jgi:hypothetical protein